MKRTEFLKNTLAGMGLIVALPTIATSCSNDDTSVDGNDSTSGDGTCTLSPSETAGPFPIKTPADFVRENIVSDRNGVALLITITVQDQSNNCVPLANTYVDLWHCDAEGNYSEYGGTKMQQVDYSNKHFLRGRQLTDANGQVSFISVFPGWYKGRAPHIHLEILDSNEKSLRVTQIAFPKDVCDAVYATDGYQGTADTLNAKDNVFSDSIDGNMANALVGNVTDGYTLTKTVIV